MRVTTVIWVHKPTGKLYSIQWSDSGQVTFAIGSLHAYAVIQDAPAIAAWVNEHLDEFELAEGTVEVVPKAPEKGTPIR